MDAKIPGSFQSFTPGIFWEISIPGFFIPRYLRAHDPGIKSPGILSMYQRDILGYPGIFFLNKIRNPTQ